MVQGCYYIAVVDAAKFFYQWPLRRDHRNRLAVITHRGQELFHVAIMGFINSVPYVQRQMDPNLKELRAPTLTTSSLPLKRLTSTWIISI